MGSYEPLSFVYTGQEPEFFVTDIANHEPAPGASIRLYVATRRSGLLVTQYTSVIPIPCLLAMARRSLQVAMDHHNSIQLPLTH